MKRIKTKNDDLGKRLARLRSGLVPSRGFVSDRLFWVSLVAALLFVISICSYKFRFLNFDDAYIHFRIAENFATGNGPFFNVGQKVMSTSSLLWTCLLALVSVVGVKLEPFVVVFNSLIIVFGSFFWGKLVRDFAGVTRALTAVFCVVYSAVLMPVGIGLMETPLALCLLGLGVLLLLDDKKSGWVFLVAAAFTRLELAVFTPLFILVRMCSHRYNIKDVFITGAVLLFFIGLQWSLFSVVLPNTVSAKSIVYDQSHSDVFNSILKAVFPDNDLIYFFVFVIILAICCFSVTRESENVLTGVVFVVGGVVISLAYVLERVLIASWYVPLIVIPLLFGGVIILKGQHWVFAVIFSMLLSYHPLKICSKYLLSAAGFRSYSFAEAAPSARVQRYMEVGSCLNRLLPEKTLASSEIGGLGYSYKGMILDGVGLVTPEALDYHPMKVPEQRSSSALGAIPALFVDESKPDIIVTYPCFSEEFSRSKYVSQYTRIDVPPLPEYFIKQTGCESVWGNSTLYIYIKNSLVTPSLLSSINDCLNWGEIANE